MQLYKSGFYSCKFVVKMFPFLLSEPIQIGLFNTFVRLVSEFKSPIWSPHLEKDIKAVKRVQSKAVDSI